jgi:hypothetical protein
LKLLYIYLCGQLRLLAPLCAIFSLDYFIIKGIFLTNILTNLICNVNIFDILGSIINSIIALIAIIAVIISYRQFYKNIRISKIEEIFSLCELLGQHYSKFFELYNLLLEHKEKGISINLRNDIYKRYNDERSNYLKDFDIKDLIKSNYRLEVLSKSYLKGDLQLHVLSYSRMIRHIIDISISQQWIYKEMYWKNGFPNITEFNFYLDKIEHKFVKIISITNQNLNNLSRKSIMKFCENEFKSEIGIKEIKKEQ